MMKLNANNRTTFLTLVSSIFILLMPLAQAEKIQSQSPRKVATELKAYKGIHANSLANRFILKKNTKIGTLHDFKNHKVSTGKNGRLMPLPLVASKILSNHKLFQTQLKGVPATAFFKAKRPVDEVTKVIETPTEYVIILETHMLIQDPAQLQNAPGMKLFHKQQMRNRKLPKENKNKRKVERANLLNGTSKAGKNLTLYMNQLKTIPHDHPLKMYAMKNDREGLVKAIAEGKGEMTMTTTVAIPKNKFVAPKPLANIPLDPTQRVKPINRVNPTTLGLGVIHKLPQLVTIRCVGKAGTVRPGEGESDDPELKLRTGSVDGAQEIFHLAPVGNGLYPAYRMDTAYGHGYGISSREGKEALSFASEMRPSPSKHVRTITNNTPSKYHAASTYGFIPVKGTVNTYKIRDLELDKYLVVDHENRLFAKGTEESASQFVLTAVTNWKPTSTFSVGGFHGDKTKIRFNLSPAGKPRVRMIPRVAFATKRARRTTPWKMSFGTAITVSPSHPDYLFVPASRNIDFRSNDNYGFRVIPRTTGSMDVNAKLLAGYTVKRGFNWEVTYSYPSGRFSAGAHAELAFGLRAPIRLKGSVSPAQINLRKGDKVKLKVELEAEGVDGRASFYEAAGLSEQLIQDGSEFTLNASAGYHLYLKALWEVYVDERWEKTFDYGRDIRFPVGENDRSNIGRWWIPPALTYSDFSAVDDVNLGIDIIDATISLGAKLDLNNGKARVKITPNLAGENKPSNTINLLPKGTTSFELDSESVGDNTPFGVSIDLVSYTFGIELTPSIKLSAPVSIDLFFDSFERDFGTIIDLPSLSISLGDYMLPKHKGTNAHQVFGGSASVR